MVQQKQSMMSRIVLGLLAALLVVATIPGSTHAQSVNHYNSSEIKNQLYEPTGCDPSQGDSAGGGNLVGSDNIEKAYNYFVQKGLQPFQSAGIIGNLMQESGVNPKSVQPGGAGRGIAQWSEGGRWAVLQSWAGNRDIWALDTQLDFIWHEMNNVAPWKEALPAVKGATTIEAATEAFEEKYEKAGLPNMPRRIQNAKQVLAKYGNGAPSGAPSAGSNEECTNGGGGVATVGDFTFPLKTNKSIILNNQGNAKWCSDKQENCHHDYNAADIGVPTGTVVIAAKPGTVAHTQNGRAANVGILGDDKHLYYYTHMGPGTIKVRKGQAVAQAAPLGNVGTSADAQGTSPHLHFDMQPPPATGRPNCSGTGCKSYNFLNVQPPLVQAFQALPD